MDVNPAFVVLLGVETRASVPDSALRDKIEVGEGNEAIARGSRERLSFSRLCITRLIYRG